ncbi:hypothetical protein C4544_00770 [candidate division WS5 bacterium]|uniref:Prepilin-type N-terminal cleavage/methylation domain-containing protein n=1 Tax=candidate division WS5 bacterium TaxID=2093353 RepID=A0A419DG52_9BACT|nr:MAG: hypothetical protein C4544_00770 [candidate division WS5 bacterium]
MIWRGFKKKDGYSITELVVVMGIIAILLPLSFGAYNSTRKQKYTQHVANITQINIRDTFIDIVSTKTVTGSPCDGGAPQIKALRIQLGEGESAPEEPLKKVAICQDTDGSLAASVAEEDISVSSGINYKQKIRTYFNTPWGTYPSNQAAGFLYLVFTSPYGKYYSYYTPETNPATANASFRNAGWEKNMDTDIYAPVSDLNLGYLKVYFNSDIGGGGTEHQIWITSVGNVELH